MQQRRTTIPTRDERREVSRKEDADLIERAVAGDQQAFTQLRQKYYPTIAGLIRRMMRNSDDIEDLIQETFVKAFNAIATFNHDYAFSTWLYRIASNHCIDFLRKKRLKTFSIDQPLETSDGEMQYEISDSTWLPDSDIHNREKTALLQNAIQELPDKYRVVIELRHSEELDYQEIANKLGLPLGTVKAHLFRAREMLYKKLKSKMYYFYS